MLSDLIYASVPIPATYGKVGFACILLFRMNFAAHRNSYLVIISANKHEQLNTNEIMSIISRCQLSADHSTGL